MPPCMHRMRSATKPAMGIQLKTRWKESDLDGFEVSRQEEIGTYVESLVEVRVAVPPHDFVVETVDSVDRHALMVSSQNVDVTRRTKFHGEHETDGFHAHRTSIYVVPWKNRNPELKGPFLKEPEITYPEIRSASSVANHFARAVEPSLRTGHGYPRRLTRAAALRRAWTHSGKRVRLGPVTIRSCRPPRGALVGTSSTS